MPRDPNGLATIRRRLAHGEGLRLAFVDLAQPAEPIFATALGRPAIRAAFDWTGRFLAVVTLETGSTESALGLFAGKRVRVFDVEARAEVAAFEIALPGPAISVGFSPDARHILTAGPDIPLLGLGLGALGLGAAGEPGPDLPCSELSAATGARGPGVGRSSAGGAPVYRRRVESLSARSTACRGRGGVGSALARKRRGRVSHERSYRPLPVKNPTFESLN